MADNNQITILSQSVEVWNKWREENPDALIDLKNAKLMHMNLENSNLKNAYLVDANLEGTILSAVNFRNANLSSVTFDQKVF